MKKTTLTLLLAFIAMALNAQNFNWAKGIGGSWNLHNSAIVADNNGNTYIAGYFMSTVDFDPGPGVYNLTSNGSYDICFYKLDSMGNLVWAKQIGGFNDDRATSVAIDANNNIYATGYFQGSVDFDPGPNVFNINSVLNIPNIYVLKLDASGNLGWAKLLGGFGNGSGDFAQGLSIGLDAANNVYTTGFFQGTFDFDPDGGTYNLTSYGDKDAYISKLNSAGSFVWALHIGGTSGEGNYAIKVDPSGSFYVKGFYSGTIDFDPGPGVYNLTISYPYFYALSKFDASGNLIYTQGSPGSNFGSPHSMGIDATGNFFNIGAFSDVVDFDPGPGVFNLTSASSGYFDIFITKTDPSGNFLWAKQYGGTASDSPLAIAIDASGNLYLTGTGFNTPGIFISKLDNNGNVYWTENIGIVSDIGNAIAVDNASHIYTTGDFKQTVDFNPGAGVYNLTASGASYEASEFVQKMTQGGCVKPTGSISVLTNDSVCAGNTATLQANASPAISYQWYKGSNIIAGANAAQLNVSASGTYKVTVSNGTGCSKTLQGKTITVVALPAAIITAAGPTTFCAGQNVVLNANNTTGITYQWIKGGNNLAGAINPSYTASQAGTYKCRATNSFGCSKTSNSIKVIINCREAFAEEVPVTKIYPNPANENATLELNATADFATITITDVIGKEKEKLQLELLKDEINSIVITTKNLTPGIYFLTIENGEQIQTLRLVVSH